MTLDSQKSIKKPRRNTYPHLKYRADIDGLRALAITMVVLYHAFPRLFPGGFVGVDVFFVISGFLISSIIFKQVELGQFKFSDFYVRRINRLFPSLLTVLFACYLLGKHLLLPDEFMLLGKHFITGLGFGQNIALHFEAGYFDTSSHLKPLMHLWSLGIEEQFYFLFPIVVLAICRISKYYLPLFLVILTFFSFVANIYVVGINPSSAFFNPFTRFWELLIGSLLACLVHFKPRIKSKKLKRAFLSPYHSHQFFNMMKHENTRSAVSFLGFSLIVFSVYVVNERVFFPGWWAILPVVGALLIISSGPTSWLNRSLLGNKFVVWVGLISYPLYLWHWPLLAFANIVEPEGLSYKVKLVILCLSIFFAWITFVLIERPIRSSTHTKPITSGLLSFAVTTMAVGFLMVTGIVKPNSEEYGVSDIVAAVGEWEHPKGLSKMSINGVDVVGIDGSRKTLFIGDSNADQYSPRVVELLKDKSNERGAIFLTGGGCLPIPGVSAKVLPHCDAFFERYLRVAEDRSIDRIVISALWHHYLEDKDDVDRYINDQFLITSSFGRSQAFESLDSFINDLSSPNRSIYIVLNIPIGRELDPKGMIKRDFFSGFKIEAAPINKADYISEFKKVYDGFSEIALRNDVDIINPLDHLCDETYCYGVDMDKKAMYKDSVHLRPSFVRESVHYIDKTIVD